MRWEGGVEGELGEGGGGGRSIAVRLRCTARGGGDGGVGGEKGGGVPGESTTALQPAFHLPYCRLQVGLLNQYQSSNIPLRAAVLDHRQSVQRHQGSMAAIAIHQSIRQSINVSINQVVNQSMHQSINSSINQCNNQSMHRSINHSPTYQLH